MASVQFRSAAEALQAFNNTECEAWSLWQGKQFMFKGIGSDELKAFIDLIEQSEISNASYTIAYYEDVADKKKINNKTPFDGSFNFLIRSSGEEVINYRQGRLSMGNDVQSRIGALENKLDKVLEGLTGDDEPENKLGVIGEIIGHPSIAPVMPLLINSVLEKLLGPSVPAQQSQPMQPMRKVSGIGNVLEQDEVLANAIERLLRADPKLPEHLTKLADMSDKDRNGFNFILMALEKLP